MANAKMNKNEDIVIENAAQNGNQSENLEEEKPGLFARLGARFNEALQSSRGEDRLPAAAPSAAPLVDDIAIRRSRNVVQTKMFIPEGVTVEGSVSGGTDAEISGRVCGDVRVDGRLALGPSGVISGNVRALSARIEGLVEGKIECVEELELGKTGRLNAGGSAGKRIFLAGQVYGNMVTPGALKLAAGCVVNGDIQTRSLVMEEGAALNGACSMRSSAQRNTEVKA